MLWLTADHHFGHENIIKYTGRPFENVWNMNVALSTAWRDVVHKDDLVVHLGDVTMIKRPDAYVNTMFIIEKLPGKKILVKGNHDKQKMIDWYRDHQWVVVDKILLHRTLFVHSPPLKISIDHPRVIHGHVHGRPTGISGYYDVGVDAREYKPIAFRNLLPMFTKTDELIEQELFDLYERTVK